MKIKELLSGLPVQEFSGNEEEDIRGIAYSSEDVGPGYLFAALKGEKRDGYEFIGEAVRRGASAVLSERPKAADFPKSWIRAVDAREVLALCSAAFYSHPSRSLKVLGVTGTKGKTTVSYLLENILKKAGFIPGVIGTISYRGPGLDMEAGRTTPEAPDLQKLLRRMLDGGATHCVIEVSSHALDLKRVWGINFETAVFTNLSGEHLDYHHTMESYFEAKKKLFFINHKKRSAVVNTDDPWGKKLITELPMTTITFGLEPASLVRGEKYELNSTGTETLVTFPGGRFSVSSPLLGKHNIYNILASVAATLALNIPVRAIQEGISSAGLVPGRFEKIVNRLGLQVIVDYAHTDTALKSLLDTVRELKPGRILLVFGAGGDRDKSKRERMGEVAASGADWVFLTSDNPRSEDPMAIISDIEKGFKKTGSVNYTVIPDRKEAIEKALSAGKKGDHILVAGKGHETYQILKDITIPFNDVEVIRSILEKMEATANG